MPTESISIDATLKARLADLATQAGQPLDAFIEAWLWRLADLDVRFDRGVPVFPRRPGAPVLTVRDVDRLASDNDVEPSE